MLLKDMYCASVICVIFHSFKQILFIMIWKQAHFLNTGGILITSYYIFQVQSTAQTIKSHLEADGIEAMTSQVTSPPARGIVRQDKSAGVWANMDSIMYRTDWNYVTFSGLTKLCDKNSCYSALFSNCYCMCECLLLLLLDVKKFK